MKWSFPTLLAATAATGIAAVSGAAAYASGTAYGPAPAAGQTSSGGFSQVLTTATRGSAGGTLTAKAGGTSINFTIPAGTLNIPLQLTLTEPNRAQLGRKFNNSRLAHLRVRPNDVLGGVGVTGAKTDGTPIRGRLSAETLTVTLSNHAFHPGDRIVVWSAARRSFVPVSQGHVDVRDGKVTIRCNRPSEFVILAPSR